MNGVRKQPAVFILCTVAVHGEMLRIVSRVERYAFIKMDDGTFSVCLEESWYQGGSHNDGGTVSEPIPEEWFKLQYDGFLENLVTLASASRYGFSADVLKNRKGMKEFFGFEK